MRINQFSSQPQVHLNLGLAVVWYITTLQGTALLEKLKFASLRICTPFSFSLTRYMSNPANPPLLFHTIVQNTDYEVPKCASFFNLLFNYFLLLRIKIMAYRKSTYYDLVSEYVLMS